MSSLWQNIRGRFDRNKNPAWGWRMSLLYGMGVWTMLGYLFLKWTSNGDALRAAYFGESQQSFKEMSEEEQMRIISAKNVAVLKRQQELAEYVAENIYTPVDFMG